MERCSAEHTKGGLDSCWWVHFQFFFFFARGKEKNEGIEGMNVPGKEELGNVGWKNKVLKEEIP